MFLFQRHKTEMVAPEEALPGRDATMPVPERHDVLGTPLTPPVPRRLRVARRSAWAASGAPSASSGRLPGVYTTAVGYAGGFTPNPTYEEVCSGRTGHTEAVLVVCDPARSSREEILRAFWEGHDPTQGMRQGNDVGHAVPLGDLRHRRRSSAPRSRRTRELFQRELTAAGYGEITTEIADAGPFYYAEPYHQQYLAKNPNGYCGLGGTGVSCPVGVALS